MDSTYPVYQYEESHSQTHRSRTSSSVSTTEGLFQSLKLVEAPVDTSGATSYLGSRLQASQGPASSIYITSAIPTTPALLPTSSSQPHSPFPLISDSVPDADWFHTLHATTETAPTTGAPLLRVESSPGHSQHRTSSTASPRTTQSASMRFAPSGIAVKVNIKY
jgi:hypothetical protein